MGDPGLNRKRRHPDRTLSGVSRWERDAAIGAGGGRIGAGDNLHAAGRRHARRDVSSAGRRGGCGVSGASEGRQCPPTPLRTVPRRRSRGERMPERIGDDRQAGSHHRCMGLYGDPFHPLGDFMFPAKLSGDESVNNAPHIRRRPILAQLKLPFQPRDADFKSDDSAQ